MDREKVIKHFEHLLNAAKGNYQDFVDLTVDAGEEILALLKEQEAVEPKWQQGKAFCGSCGKRIPLKIGARYCHKCGQKVKWG